MFSDLLATTVSKEPAFLITLFSLLVSPVLMLLLQSTTAKCTALASTDWYLEQFAVHTERKQSLIIPFCIWPLYWSSSSVCCLCGSPGTCTLAPHQRLVAGLGCVTVLFLLMSITISRKQTIPPRPLHKTVHYCSVLPIHPTTAQLSV